VIAKVMCEVEIMRGHARTHGHARATSVPAWGTHMEYLWITEAEVIPGGCLRQDSKFDDEFLFEWRRI